MKRFSVTTSGEDPTFEAYTPEPLKSGEVAVDIKAAALNHADLLMIKGRYQDTPEPPFGLGLEGAGVIAKVGRGAGLEIGTRVAVFSGQGCLAERLHVDANRVVPIPDALAFDVAAALPIAFGTAHLGLMRRARAKAGEVLLVTGAGGGAGLAAVRLGKALGLKVLASARSADHREQALKAGAHAAFDTEIGEQELTDQLRAHGPIDIVYDTVGGGGLAPIMRAVKPEGRVVLIGFVGGLPEFKSNHLLVKNQTIIGLNISAYPSFAPETLKESLAAVMDLAAKGAIEADIGHRLAFEDTQKGLDLLRDRKAVGKVVIEIA